MFQQLLELPFAALGVLHRWANDRSREVVAKFWIFVLAYLGIAWAGAALDAPWLVVGAMWAATFFAVNFYTQPAILGGLGLLEFFLGSDDPNKKSVIRAGLLIFISIACAGGSAIILGWIGAPEVFPLAILVILLAVACSLAIGAAQLDKWLRFIAIMGAAILFVATIGAVHPAALLRIGIDVEAMRITRAERAAAEGAGENYRAADKATQEAIRTRFGAKMEAGTMTPEDWAAVQRMLGELRAKADTSTDPISATDREVRTLRDAKKKEWIALVQRCRVTEANVARFTPEQQALYREKCGDAAAVKGLTLEEIRRGWPHLFEYEAVREGGGAAGKSRGEVAPSFWRDPKGWVMYYWHNHPGYVMLLLLAHVIPVWLWRRWKKKKTEASATSSATTAAKKEASSDKKLGNAFAIAGILALAGALGYLFLPKASGWWEKNVALRDAVPAVPISIGNPGVPNNRSVREVVAYIGFDQIGTGLERAEREPLPLAIKEGSYATDELLHLRICAKATCRSGDPPDASDLVFDGRCVRMREITRRTCTHQWNVLGKGLAGENFTFEAKVFPTSISIEGNYKNRFGRRERGFTLTIFPNRDPELAPVAAQ